MTATLTRPPEVRYFRRFAGRTARWTLIVTTALVAGQYVVLTLGVAGVAGAFVGGLAAAALGMTAAAGTDGHRWAAVLTAAVWAGWLLAGHVRHGWANLSALAVLLAAVATVVACGLALADHHRRQTR